MSLFSSAYTDVRSDLTTFCFNDISYTSHLLQVVDDAEAQYLAFFAGKTVGMIRAPDSYVYPAPFNLVEIFLIAPFEYVSSSSQYLAWMS